MVGSKVNILTINDLYKSKVKAHTRTRKGKFEKVKEHERGFFESGALKRLHQKRSTYGKTKHEKPATTVSSIEKRISHWKEQIESGKGTEYAHSVLERLEKIKKKMEKRNN